MSRRKGGSASSNRWVARQARDPYARRAREGKVRSRAYFKLEQLDRRDRLFRPGQRVVDLGAAPGGWSQYLAARLDGGPVVATDVLEMAPLPGVTFVHGDFLDDAAVERVIAALGGVLADAVVSDMAPNLSGVRERDEAGMTELAGAALALAARVLRPGGLLLLKTFEGAGRNETAARLRECFREVAVRKPDASRSASAECYLVAKGYNPRHGVPRDGA